MPPFPKKPADRHDRLRYLAEVVWWVLSSAWLIFLRFPKWVRVLIAIWLLFGFVFKSCSVKDNDDDIASKNPAARTADKEAENAQKAAKLDEAAAKLDKLGSDPDSGKIKSDLLKASAEIVRDLSTQIQTAGNRWTGQLGVTPFTTDPAAPSRGSFAEEVFNRVFGTLSQVSPSQVKLRADAADQAALVAASQKAGDTYILQGRVSASTLSVSVIRSRDGSVLWTHDFATGESTAPDTADMVSRGVEDALSKEPHSP
jgi:TolB-like protein